MRKILTFLLLIGTLSCTRNIVTPWQGLSFVQPQIYTSTMIVSYGQGSALYFNANEIRCVLKNFSDSSKAVLSIVAGDGIYSLVIAVKTNSLSPAVYKSCGAAMRKYTIADTDLPPYGNFTLDIASNDAGRLNGSFSGVLTDPDSGALCQVSGTLNFVPVYYN